MVALLDDRCIRCRALNQSFENIGGGGDRAGPLTDEFRHLLGVLERGGQNISFEATRPQGLVDFCGDVYTANPIVVHAVDTGRDITGIDLHGHKALYG